MVPTLRAEFKKLLTVRSTYFLVLLAVLLSGFFTYLGTSPMVYEEEVDTPASSQQTAQSPPPQEARTPRITRDLSKEKLFTNLQDAIPVISILIAIAVVLLMGHEFRYNTITHTLTASNSRSKVLLSKIIVSAAFTVTVTLLTIAVIVAATYLAVAVKDLNLPPQGSFNWTYILGRLIGYALGFSLLGLAIITLVRSLIAGVVALFLLPTIDAIGGALLASRDIEASRILPFSALSRIVNLQADYLPHNVPDDGITDVGLLPATLLGATAVFAAYLVGVWIVSWYLFLRRDAV